MVFRRRPPRPRRPIGLGGRPLRRGAMLRLRTANQLFEEKQWLPAAEHFERLAAAAANRGLPQAPQLFLRAGRARLENGDHETGLAHLHESVRLFGQLDQFHRLYQIRPRIVNGLKDLGLEREALELDQAIHAILDQQHSEDDALSHSDTNLRFPPKCTSCGASLRPDEMEHIDSQTGVCGYCGSVNHTN
jgi:hypothetical protein